MQQGPRWVRVGPKPRQGVRVLGLGGCRPPNARQVAPESGPVGIANAPEVGVEGGDRSVAIEGEEEKLAAVHHPGEHGTDDGVVRSDQEVVPGEAVELKYKLYDRILRGAQQRVAEPETGGGDGGREDGVRADRQETAGPPLDLDPSERAARPRRGQELSHERTVHRQPGQQRDNMAHSVGYRLGGGCGKHNTASARLGADRAIHRPGGGAAGPALGAA